MSAVGATFALRWASARHVGAATPQQRIEIRTGKLQRGWKPWGGAAVDAQIPGESKEKPWQATWNATSDWKVLPNVLECSIEQDFDQNGLATATVQVENVILRPANGNLGQLYHLVDRGALAPWRGYTAPGRTPSGPGPNEWYDLLTHHSQIRVYQGYGDAMEEVFTGLIESVDPDSTPDRLTLTVRDFGGPTLVDQHVFGFNNGPKVPEPAIFVAKGALEGDAQPVGYSPRASSTRDGHPPRLILDSNEDSFWLSTNRSGPELTEWVDIRVPRGRYQSIILNPHYAGQTAYLSVYARNRGMGGDLCKLDDLFVPNGWIDLAALHQTGGGIVPGATNGGRPYTNVWTNTADKYQELLLGHTIDLGDDSVFRLHFRHLKMIDPDNYRAGAARFQAVKRKLPPARKLREVGKSARASSTLPASGSSNYHASNVLDSKRSTRWVSENRHDNDLTEWVSIRVPQGVYDSFRIEVFHPNYEMYVGVYARPLTKRAAGKVKPGEAVRYDYAPCKVDGVEMAMDYQVGEGAWVNLTGQGIGGVVPGELPPAGNGGWPYFMKVDSVRLPASKAETYSLGHKLELGNNSVLRIGFRNLHKVDERHDDYRASVRTLKALTTTGVTQPTKKKGPAKIIVGDVADVVRVALRWAGFKEWEIENVGTSVSGEWTFNRSNTLMDIVQKCCEASGYVFFIDRPSAWESSIGVPIFREARALKTIPNVPIVRDTNLLTGIQAHITEEPLSHLIRIRGNANKKGVKYGADHTKRLMSEYRPPWARSGRLAHILKHFIHTDDRLKDQQSVDVFARLVAIREAMQAGTATIEVPGTPQFGLDDHIALVDVGTGFNTRLYVATRTTVFHRGVDSTTFKTTLGGSLLDTPDFAGALADLLAILPAGTSASGALANLGEPT